MITSATFRFEGTSGDGFPSWMMSVAGGFPDEQWLRDLADHLALNPANPSDTWTVATIEINTVETGTVTPNP